MSRALSRIGPCLLAAAVVLLGLVGDLHVHVDHHDGTCLDRPDGDHSRLHAHGPCAVCQNTRPVVAEVGSTLAAACGRTVEGLALPGSQPPPTACLDLSTPPRAPPALL